MGTQEEIYRDVKNSYRIKKVRLPQDKWPNDITRALKCLNDNIFNQGFTVAKMRQNCNIPQRNFSSRFKHYVGYTPVSYIKYHRIQCSVELIHNFENNLSIIQLAFEMGYEYPSTYGNAFKNIVGLSPKEYWRFCKKK